MADLSSTLPDTSSKDFKKDLLAKIKQLAGLTDTERAELVKLLNDTKKYGLIWEDKPEAAEELLRTKLPVLREVVERRIFSESEFTELENEQNKNVITINRGLFDDVNEIENQDNQINQLNHGSDIVPPNHILIEGDNLHALTALTFTHEGKIDVIYIDPPYNTGNKDFRYHDAFKDEPEFIDKEHSFRHSTWLSFINKRLKIARRLMSDKGVIFISIDDNEQAQLKLLCDEVLGENNFVSELIWKKKQGGGNDSTNFVVEHEYIICYSKSLSNIKLNLDSSHVLDDSLYPFKNENGVEYGLITLDKSSIRFSESLVFEINDKDGNTYYPRIVKGKQSCWRWGKKKVEEEFDDLVFKNGKVYTKYYRPSGIVPKSILYDTRFGRTESGKDAIKDVLGNSVLFTYPKPLELISHILKISTQTDSTILDFFAGSGTTLHATMQLNAEDGGNRQCILVTNNENNICEEVTYERNRRVIQGYTNAKGNLVEGLKNNNLRYYQVDFVDSAKTEVNRRKLTVLSTNLLQIKEECYHDITEAEGFDRSKCSIHSNEQGKYMVVIYHSRTQIETTELLSKWIASRTDLSEKVKIYAFGHETEIIVDDFYAVADKIDAVPLPDAIYNAYRATFRTLKLDKKAPVSFVEANALTENENE